VIFATMQIVWATVERLWDLVGHAGRFKLLDETVSTGAAAIIIALYHQLSSILVPTKGHDSDKSIGVGSLATILATGVWGWFLFDHANGPIIWMIGDGPHPIFGMRGGGSEHPFISKLQISGNNRSDEPVSNVDGFLRSNITNKKLPLFFQINGKYVRTIDTNGVPPHADFMIVVPFTDDQAKFETITIPSDQFLSEYGDLTLSVTFDGRGLPMFVISRARSWLG
jgi:hypothetical protein